MIGFDSMVNILISPVEGCGGFVVLLDVTKELSREVSFGSEDSSSNDRELNFRKPDFDLIEPTRIGWIRTAGLALRNSKTLLVLCALKLSTTM